MIDAPVQRNYTTEPFQLPGSVGLPPPVPGPTAAKPPNVIQKSGASTPTTTATTQPTPNSAGGAAPPPPGGVTTQPQPAPTISGPSTTQNMQQFLNGQNPFGTAGFDIMNTIGAMGNNGAVDPRLSQFYTVQNQGSEGTQNVLYPSNPRLDPSGAIINPANPKDPFVQVGNLPDGRVLDMSKVTYDPEFGAITTESNINQKQLQDDPFSKYFPWLAVGGGIAGPALAGAAGILDAGGGAGATTAVGGGDESLGLSMVPGGGAAPVNIPGAADALTPSINNAIDTSLMPPVTPTTIPELAPPPDIVPPGASLPPPADLGPAAGNQSLADSLGNYPSLLNGDAPLNVDLQPPPNVDVPPPDFQVSNGGSLTDRLMNSVTNDPVRALSGAATVGSLIAGRGSNIPSSLTNTVNANAPTQAAANATLQNNGAPTGDQLAAITSTINQQRTQGTEAIIQASINAGQGGKDSMVVQDKIRAFNTQLATLQIQMTQKQAAENIQTALAELGLMNGEQFQLANLEIQQSNENMQRITSIMQSLGWLFSTGSGK